MLYAFAKDINTIRKNKWVGVFFVDNKCDKMSMSNTWPLLLGGLVLFLYAINQLSGALKSVFDRRAKKVIRKYTNNILSAVLIGTLITILLGSSSAAIIITIIFVNARSLNFRQAMGIVMGANIGTTFSSQIIAMDVSKYAVILLGIGIAMSLFIRNERLKRTGSVLLYFGMLFFGLYAMEESVLPLQDSTSFKEWIVNLDNPWKGALVGGLVTLFIQSSSATVGLAITLGKQHLINISGGIAVMLGAELGTCSDTLLATINGRRQAIKTGVFHLVFNFLTIIIGLVLFFPFVAFVKAITVSDSIQHHIANAHMFFNICGVLLFLPFAGQLGKLLDRLIPEKPPAKPAIKTTNAISGPVSPTG